MWETSTDDACMTSNRPPSRHLSSRLVRSLSLTLTAAAAACIGISYARALRTPSSFAVPDAAYIDHAHPFKHNSCTVTHAPKLMHQNLCTTTNAPTVKTSGALAAGKHECVSTRVVLFVPLLGDTNGAQRIQCAEEMETSARKSSLSKKQQRKRG